jgi:hypothetical protein
MQGAVDRVDEAREAALVQVTTYQQSLRRYHAKNVQPRALQVGDRVLRRVQTAKDWHELSPLWEGSYVVSRVLRPSAYKLKNLEGEEPTDAWDIEHLRRAHVFLSSQKR